MASMIDTIKTRLESDAALVGTLGASGYSGVLQGGVWARPLKEKGNGATPEAFYVNQKGNFVRPAAVVLDRGDAEHAQQTWIPTAYSAVPVIYLYAPATHSGRTSIEDARELIFDLLNDWNYQTDNGPIAFLRYMGRFGVSDSEEFVGAIFDYCRYEVISRHRNAV